MSTSASGVPPAAASPAPSAPSAPAPPSGLLLPLSAHAHLLSAVRHSQMNDSDHVLAEAVWHGSDIVDADIAATLDANAQALTHLRHAIAAPHFRLPELAADEFDVVPEIPLETESLIALLRLQSMYNARRGEWDIAFDNALDILRLAQRIEGANHAALATTMLSVGYRSVGLETLRRLTSLAPLANEQALGRNPAFVSQ